jgi:hypothetical protein
VLILMLFWSDDLGRYGLLKMADQEITPTVTYSEAVAAILRLYTRFI